MFMDEESTDICMTVHVTRQTMRLAKKSRLTTVLGLRALNQLCRFAPPWTKQSLDPQRPCRQGVGNSSATPTKSGIIEFQCLPMHGYIYEISIRKKGLKLQTFPLDKNNQTLTTFFSNDTAFSDLVRIFSTLWNGIPKRTQNWDHFGPRLEAIFFRSSSLVKP